MSPLALRLPIGKLRGEQDLLAQSSPARKALWLAAGVAAHVLVLVLLLHGPRGEPVTPPQTFAVEMIAPESRAPAPAPRQPEPRPTPAKAPPLAREPSPTALSTPAPPVSAVAEAAPSPRAAPPTENPAPISQPRFDAAYLNNPLPAYPTLSKRMNEQGRVELRVHVLPSGLPDQVEIHKSSTHPRLDNAALEAVKRWRFVPAKQGSEAVAAWVIVPMPFILEN